jgi:anti-anti-sigma factor
LARKHNGKRTGLPAVAETVVDVARGGDWLPLEELRAVALSAAVAEGGVTLNLVGVDHLDASALQILLALAGECKKRGRGLRLANVSQPLSRWFEYAGGGRTCFQDLGEDGNA